MIKIVISETRLSSSNLRFTTATYVAMDMVFNFFVPQFSHQ